MNDFRSYKPEEKEPPKNTGGINSTVELAKAVTNAMQGKTEGQLLRTIIFEAERGKREGTLSNADIDNFYNALAPMLDGVKRKKLKEVVTRLKNL